MAKKGSKKKSFWGWCIRIFLFFFLSSTAYVVVCKWVMPPVTITQLGDLMKGHGLKKDYIRDEEIGINLKLAAIASEDQLFPLHQGFDWKAIESSITPKSTKSKRIRGAGASTISQQVAKNVFLWQGEGLMRYIRKVPEFYFTKMIEWIWGKQRILEVYLNVIEMGPGIFGAEAAAQTYFHKPAKNLSRKEAAMIIACLPNPKIYTVQPVSRWVAWRSQAILKQMKNIENDPDLKPLLK